MSVQQAAVAVLETAEPLAKAAAAEAVAEEWRAGGLSRRGRASVPARPARPERPILLPPGEMPRRRGGGERARIALLHAIAHIELNAIDLAFDLIARFAGPDLPRAFIDDWIAVGADEARHFRLLVGRLDDLGAAYGDLPAHGGLWASAEATSHDLAARLAVVPMVLEARGLDVTPGMIARLEQAGDSASAAILTLILGEEIAHVAAGRRWFDFLAGERGEPPVAYWRGLVARHFKGVLRPPFNHAARAQAGMGPEYYAGLG